ncbi:hypothetical protein I350_03898 [Cryptococcus amylolentus CBS 6273]|uniref:Uncharacterized protein n=1 Tax=Cryptococcus amylolentus CBS 6273 TaxID=1296118 RepID=A0A1E3K0K1_9TREE|nr:hypothetical protein I350_03898 [Cryptococcus amylolentus CBS 6273]
MDSFSTDAKQEHDGLTSDSGAPPLTDDLDTHQPSLLTQEEEAAEEASRCIEPMPSDRSDVRKMYLKVRQRKHREKKRELQSKINGLTGQSQTHNFTKLRLISIADLQRELEDLQSHREQQDPGEGGSRDSTMEKIDAAGGEEGAGEEGEGEDEGDHDDVAGEYERTKSESRFEIV